MKLQKYVLMLCIVAWVSFPVCRAQGSDPNEIETLKAKLAEQQKQIESLMQAMKDQQAMLDRLSKPASSQTGALMASSTPMLSPAPLPTASPKLAPPTATSAAAPQADAAASPLQIQIGSATIMPVGFMDLTADWKDKNAGGSLGSNFGSVPYNNAATAKLSEFRFSPQNSRLGFRVDANVAGAHVIGYNEFDFLGQSGTNNLSVTNGAFVPRIRLYWVDVRKDKLEFLAGQSWSMLTPNRKGISALPGDLFYSQVMDVNYVAGLTWTRQPGVRILYHPSEQVTLGLSLENPDAYIGGSGGGSSIVLPTSLTGLAGTQLDSAANYQTTPNLHPDIIAKVAFDPTSRVHFEVAGIERTFKLWNTTTGTPTSGQYFTKAAAGGSVNANVEVVKNLRLITNNYWSDGGGRYMFGQAPDLVVRSDGSISPIHSGGVVEGFEAVTGKTLWFGYYGAIYVGRNVAMDTNGSLVGYGYRGSANSQNKAIQEITLGFNQTLWKDARYGALNVIGQYEYLTRDPWYVATNSPKATHDNTIYLDIRYTLPGGVPAMK